MEEAAVAEQLEAFIRERYDVSSDDPDFDRDVHLFDYGYIDSFGAVELNTFVEETFGIKVSDTDLMVHSLNTINEIATFITKRQASEV